MANENISFELMAEELKPQRRTEHLLRRAFAVGEMPFMEGKLPRRIIAATYPRNDLVRSEMRVRLLANDRNPYRPFSFYKSVSALMAYSDETLPGEPQS